VTLAWPLASVVMKPSAPLVIAFQSRKQALMSWQSLSISVTRSPRTGMFACIKAMVGSWRVTQIFTPAKGAKRPGAAEPIVKLSRVSPRVRTGGGAALAMRVVEGAGCGAGRFWAPSRSMVQPNTATTA